MIPIIPYLSCCCFLFLMPCYADVDAGTDTSLQVQTLSDGRYLNSANNIDKLQFCSPGTSNSKHLGFFYNVSPNMRRSWKDDPNLVWVSFAGRADPNLSMMLMINYTDGLLKISYRGGNNTVLNSAPGAKNTSATILDNGNLLLRKMNPDGSINRTLWQSFDYPTGTLEPGMKLGINFRTGHKWSITSWVTNEVPASGSFILVGNLNGSSQLMIWWQENLYRTSGRWGKGSSDGALYYDNYLKVTYVSNENEKYLTYSRQDIISPLPKVRIELNGDIEFSGESYVEILPVCSVVGKLDPGCVREMLPQCRKADIQFHGKRGLVEGSSYIYDQNQNLSLSDCRANCSQNCSCVAFTLIRNNSTACEMFHKVKRFRQSRENGEVVYFLDTGRATRWWIWLIAAAGGAFLLFGLLRCIIQKISKRKIKVKQAEMTLLHELADLNIPPGQYSGVIDAVDKKMKNQVNVFSFESLEMATNSFFTENKLGEGGFGSVYKGKLPSGQEIAIKRLSRVSGQGLLEFKNEILLIAKLQHDNLVKLLGCCIEGQEKILVYEYMPNRSLDFFIFNPSRRELINWTNRMNIIEGVAQGLLYLHKYSRFRVIHRDLKAGNILLDENMNPKISDFGMARIFGKQESEATTKRIVGTQGYMSPEYAIRGVFSMKSDVFSFGVLLLEIVSGKKNHRCYHSERPLNLIGLGWELWVEGRAIELMDPILDDNSHKVEILRCINIGLLCVQDNAADRPSMTDVITMLKNESLQLPEPKEPAFFINTSTREIEKEVDVKKACTNDLSISVMEGR